MKKKLDLEQTLTAIDVAENFRREDDKVLLIEPGPATKKATWARLFREDHDDIFEEAKSKGLDRMDYSRDEADEWLRERWEELQLDVEELSDERYIRDSRNRIFGAINGAAVADYGGLPPFRVKFHFSGRYKILMEWAVVRTQTSDGLKSLQTLADTVQTMVSRVTRTAECTYDLSRLPEKDQGRAEEKLRNMRRSVAKELRRFARDIKVIEHDASLQMKEFGGLLSLPDQQLALPETTDSE